MDRGQILFLSFAALIIVYQMIKGWRLGLVRQLVRFGALAAAYTVAYLGSRATVPFLRPLGYPDFILQCFGGAILGLLTFVAICVVGGILFKRTAHQDVGLVWFLYGATGALLGIAFGLVLTLAAADFIRLTGSLAEPPRNNASAHASPASKGESPLVAGLAEMKKSIESGVPGEVLQTLDPVPKKVYVVTSKIGRMASDTEAAERFLSYPGARELAERPEIVALRDDPEILRALRDHQYLLLLKNEKIVKAANDPKIAALLKRFDLEKALDYALTHERRGPAR
jgi:uncharacterized membrane protein required for colicin V production